MAYNPYSTTLEDLINNSVGYYYSMSSIPRIQIPVPKSFESDYARMKKLASEEDDFKKVVNVFGSVVQNAAWSDVTTAKSVLREAHGIYVETQKKLARLFGDLGNFDLAEEHLMNAHLTGEVALNYFDKVCLERKIEEDEAQELFNNAVAKTPIEYFLNRLAKQVKEGDVHKTDESFLLILKSLEQKRKIRIPSPREVDGSAPMEYGSYSRFFRLLTSFGKIRRRTYDIAIRKHIEKAVGYATENENSKYFISSDKKKILEIKAKTQDLMLDSIGHFHIATRKDAVDSLICYFNEHLNPLFDELIACREDKSHPLRKIYRPKKEKGSCGDNIIGVEDIKNSSTNLVPVSFYKTMRKKTGISISVHPFLNHIARMYARV